MLPGRTVGHCFSRWMLTQRRQQLVPRWNSDADCEDLDGAVFPGEVRDSKAEPNRGEGEASKAQEGDYHRALLLNEEPSTPEIPEEFTVKDEVRPKSDDKSTNGAEESGKLSPAPRVHHECNSSAKIEKRPQDESLQKLVNITSPGNSEGEEEYGDPEIDEDSGEDER